MDVQLPDGTIGRFPDDMKQEDIEAALQKQYSPVDSTVDAAKALDSGFVNGIPNALDTLGGLAAAGSNKMLGTNISTVPFYGPALNSFLGTKPYRPQTELGRNADAVGSGIATSLVAPGSSWLGTILGGAAGGDASYQANKFMQQNPDAPTAVKVGLPLAAGLLGNGSGSMLGNTLENAGISLLGLKPSGGLPVAPNAQESMQNVADIVRGNAATANQAVNNAYTLARQQGGVVSSNAVKSGLLPAMSNATREYSLASGGNQLGLLKSAGDLAASGKNVDLNDIYTLRRAANQGIGEPSTLLSAANKGAKTAIDQFMDTTAPNNAWQEANGLRAQYGNTFEQGLNGERGALDKVVTQPDMTGASMLQTVLGNKQAAANVADFMKAGGAQAEQVRTGMRQAMLQKLYSDSLANGSDSTVSPNKWNSNVAALVKGNPELVNQLLDPDEVAALSSSGTKGLATRLAERANTAMSIGGGVIGAVAGHQLGHGMLEGGIVGSTVPGIAKELLNHALNGRISNTYNGLLKSGYGEFEAPAGLLSRAGRLGVRSGLGAAATYGGLLR